MKEAYDNYLNDAEKYVEISGRTYYKIILKDSLYIGEQNTVMITLPMELFQDRRIMALEDENGKSFKISIPVTYSFRGPIPKWYLNSLTVVALGIEDISEIGNYVTNAT